MPTDDDLSLENWLKASGFSEHPFQSTNAETDPHLEEYFVEPDCFGEILGGAQSPKSAILFAPRGGGKTACRVIVDRWCRIGEKVGGNVFSIVYSNFDNLVSEVVWSASEGYTSKLNVHHHTAEIMKAAMVDLLDLMLSRPDLRDKSASAPFDAQAHFAHWLQLYHERLTQAHTQQWLELLKDFPHSTFAVHKVPATSTQDFSTLVTLLKAIGIDAVYILVDRVDEFSPAAHDPYAAVLFLAPLIGHLPLMELHGSAFKFFLPTEVRSFLLRERLIRQDRLNVGVILWTDQKILETLQARLRAFSNGKIPTLDAISAPELRGKIDRVLAEEACGSPRHLVLLGRLLFDSHVRYMAQTGDPLIRADELNQAIEAFMRQRKEWSPLSDRPPIGFKSLHVAQNADTRLGG